MPTILAAQLTTFAEALLEKGGFKPLEAAAIARSLIASELSGHASHGLIRIKEYINSLKKGEMFSGRSMHIIHETPNSLHVGAGEKWNP